MTKYRAIASCALAAFLMVPPKAPAFADWREDIGTFRIGMLAPDGSREVDGVSLIRDAFSLALGMKAEVFVARDYPALIDAQASGRIEYAIYSATAFATAARLCDCVEPIAAPVSANGATGLRAVLIVNSARAESARPRIAMVRGPETATGPAQSFAGANDAPPVEIVEANSAEAAEQLLKEVTVDGILGWGQAWPNNERADGGTLAHLADAGMDIQTLKIIWRGPVLSYGPHAVRTSLAGEAKVALRAFLLGLATAKPDVLEALSPELTGGFREVSAIDFATASSLVIQILEKP